MVEVFGWESTLQAWISHSKGHCVHMDELRIGFCFAELLQISISITEYRYIYLNCFPSSHSDMLSECSKPWMICNMIVINVFALCYLIVEWFFLFSYPKKRDNWNCKCNSRSGWKRFIFASYWVDNFVKITVSIVRLVRNHFEHPWTIFKHQRKIQILILLRNIFLTELQLIFFIEFKEMSLDLFSPFDVR